MVPRVDTTPHGVETLTWGSETQYHPREGNYIIPRSQILPLIYNSSKAGAKAMIPQVDTTPHDVETPPWGSKIQRHPGRIRSPDRRSFHTSTSLTNRG